MDWMVTYIYEDFDDFKWRVCWADGTEYENFIHTLVEVEVKATHQFIAVLKSLGYHVKKIDSQLEHMLISGMFSGFFEIVVHDMPQEQAAEYIKELREFYTAGWTKIMGLSWEGSIIFILELAIANLDLYSDWFYRNSNHTTYKEE